MRKLGLCFFGQWVGLGLVLIAGTCCGGAPILSEFMAANHSGLADEDGEFSDWIEIHNPEGIPVSLAGYHLTDDASNLAKWTFPATTLDAGAYRVLFASGKNRTDPAGRLHTDFELSVTGEYLALVAPDGVTVVSALAPHYPPQFEDESFGLSQAGSPPAWCFFSTPTPGASNGIGTRAGPMVEALEPNPPQPATGPLTVTARVFPVNDPVLIVRLFFRRMFGAETVLRMTDDGTGGDVEAGDDLWTAVIPDSAFAPGQMTRWRFVATDSRGTGTRHPAFHAPLDSDGYFGTVAQDARIQTALPVFHWFTSDAAAAGTAAGSRGCVYWGGVFYDNVQFTLHGQSSADFPKKSYNIDFNRTQRFQWSANAPRVADIDLLSNWADKSKVRHVLAYEVMRQAGVAAHFAFTVRVQQNGGFFSTADLVEDADETYLERAGLNKEGALYKIYDNLLNKDAGNTATNGVEKKTRRSENNSDLQALINGLDLAGQALEKYLYDTIDIPRCVNLLAVNCVIRNTDMHSKNWYLYRDTGRSGEWAMLPWDLDLSYGHVWNTRNTYYDNALYADGYVVNSTSIRLVSHLFANSKTRAMVLRRIRTLTDRFLQPLPEPGTPESELYCERRLNEQSALIDPAPFVPSDARLDFEKWGSWLQGGITVRHTNTNVAVETMAEAIQRWKTEYLPGRRRYIYDTQVVGRGGEIPLPQTGGGSTEPTLHFGAIEVRPASGNQDEEFIQLLNRNPMAVDISDWRLSGGIEHTFLAGTVLPSNGALYVCPKAEAFRARTAPPKGGQGLLVQGGYRGHLSNFGETLALIDASGATNNTTTYAAQPSDAQRYLVVSELMYHPSGDGLAEFIELLNISSSATLDLGGVRFTQGVEFEFTGSAITSLPPGGRVLLVRDLAAFNAAQGTPHPVAGVFAHGTALSNSGELIKLEDAHNGTIREFVYDDEAPWPAAADAGHSLVLIAPERNPDHALAVSWRASARMGGAPGWPDVAGFPADPEGDSDGNGECDLIDYVLGNDGGLPPIVPKLALQSDSLGAPATLRLSYPIRLSAENVGIAVFFSTDLIRWQDGTAYLARVSTEPLGDGRALVTWRVEPPLRDEPWVLIRLRAVVH